MLLIFALKSVPVQCQFFKTLDFTSIKLTLNFPRYDFAQLTLPYRPTILAILVRDRNNVLKKFNRKFITQICNKFINLPSSYFLRPYENVKKSNENAIIIANPVNHFSRIHEAQPSFSPSKACWVIWIKFATYCSSLNLFYLCRQVEAHDLYCNGKLLVSNVKQDVFAVRIVRHGWVEGPASHPADKN